MEIIIFYILGWMVVKQMHSFVKYHQSVHLKPVIFIVWILYFSNYLNPDYLDPLSTMSTPIPFPLLSSRSGYKRAESIPNKGFTKEVGFQSQLILNSNLIFFYQLIRMGETTGTQLLNQREITAFCNCSTCGGHLELCNITATT